MCKVIEGLEGKVGYFRYLLRKTNEHKILKRIEPPVSIDLLEGARSAAAALVAMSPIYELAYVSTIVMSHANGLPRIHGMRVALSGLLTSDLESPTGFLVTAIALF